MAPLASTRTFGRYVPARGVRPDEPPAVRAERGDVARFLTAFAGGLVFFSILIF